MSITDELREWFKDRIFMANGWQEIRDIADRIDAEHERMKYEYEREFEEWKHTQDTCYVKLPVDANGEVIHIGDSVMDVSDEWRNIFDACGFILNRCGWTVEGDSIDAVPEHLVHHHEPTVEDVLRECIANVCRSNAQLHEQGCPPLTMEDIDEELDEYINEFAAKLRLAGDE